MAQALIVDASEYWASELKTQLEVLGVTTLSWQNKGSGWIEDLGKGSAQWVFVDDQLPSRSGIKCIEKIHEGRGFEGNVVFMHSLQGPAASAIEAAAYNWGARFILRKPYRIAELRKILEQGRVSNS
jgi:CheY-like chemotaxis protein